jgi:multimeric flavodoxin WrbA
MLKGLKAAGALIEQIFLPAQKVESCRQCDNSGWGLCLKEGCCVIDDDFGGLVEKVRQADAVVFATPVYYSDMSESLRAFAGRLRRICSHAAGRVSIKGKPAIGVCVAGGSGGGSQACCVSLERAMSTCGLDVVDMIPVRRQNLQVKLQTLELAGKWLASKPGSE